MTEGISKHQDIITHYMYLGLLPFFAGALGPWVFADYEQWLSEAFLFYSSIIFAFLSGTIWTMALFHKKASLKRHIHIAIIFSLIPFCSYFLPLIYSVAVLFVGFLLLLFWEKLFLNTLYPAWYQLLRHRITFMVISCHMLVIWNLMHH